VNQEISKLFAFLANTISVLLVCSLVWESNVPQLFNLNLEAWRKQSPAGNDTRDIEILAVSELIEFHNFSFVSPDILYLHWKHAQPLPYLISHPSLAFSPNQHKSMVFRGMSLGSSESNVLSIFQERPDLIVIQRGFSVHSQRANTLWETNIKTCYNQLSNVSGTKLVELKAFQRKDDC
jgi:hypothetical protein